MSSVVKSKRFKPIVNLAKNSEREAAKALGSALQRLDEQLLRLNQLIGYQAEYNQRLSTSGGNGINGRALNEYRGFLAKLAIAIEQQNLLVIQARQALDEKKRFWFAKRGRSKALDTVLDKYVQNEQRQLERKEQRELDDRNNRSRSV